MAWKHDGEQSSLNPQDDPGPDLSRPVETATNRKYEPDSIPPPLAASGIIELLESDSRPTFIIEFTQIQGHTLAGTYGIYYNASLRRNAALKELISGATVPQSMSVAYNAFRGWLTESVKYSDRNECSPYSFCGLLWTAFTLKGQFEIISGTPCPAPADLGRANLVQKSQLVSNNRRSTTRPGPTRGTSGSSNSLSYWQPPLPHHIEFFRNIDWAATSLGPTKGWPPPLRQMVTLLMSDPNPVFLFWTEEDMILIYNEAAIVVVAEKHPHAQGKPGKESFAEVWAPFAAQFASVFTSGKALRHENVPAHLRRHGRMDECYVTYTYLPIINESGSVMGIYETFQDVTRQVIFGRRLSLLLEISTCSANVRETKLFWKRLLEVLGSNHNDVPFAILYSVEEIWENDIKASGATQIRPRKICTLEGSLGLPAGHAAAPAILHFETGAEGYSSAFRKALETEDHVLLRRQDGSLPESYVTDLECRRFGEPCNAAVVCPIRPTGGENIVGFLVLGFNPRLGYDEDDRQFIDILRRQIATSVAAVVLLDEEIRRGRTVAEDAALGHAKLKQQLDMTYKELMESENKFEVMADDAPVGMVTADTSGRIIYANKAWYEISGHSQTANDTASWLALFEDPDFCQVVLMGLLTTGEPTTIEARLKKPYVKEILNSEILEIPRWILVSAHADKAPDGSVKMLRATVTDISQQKWAEEIQKRRTEEAIELKRQQEAFIDMTSHEMRNPLSAIIQCADAVITSLARARVELRKMPYETQVLEELVETDTDAVETIILCAQHQKRIIDDVLTLSKLDSNMLLITPVEFQPLHLTQNVLKMFQGEAKKHGIGVHLRVDESYRSSNVNWLRLDPSRLTQVLVNILGNAIKFTQTSSKKQIVVTIGVSDQPPEDENPGIAYIPVQTPVDMKLEDDNGAERDRSAEVFLWHSVQDTGRGLTPHEKQKLFKRFGQASPRTHVEYGGSGLGLFISRKLTEMQGGAIGFASEFGKGSTFAFYVRAQRALSPVSALTTSDMSQLDAIDKHNKLAILIVEDNLVNQRVLCKQLRSYGHVVYTANHGGEAIAFLQESNFWKHQTKTGKPLSVVLMDTEMPIMDGLTCVRKVRELQREGSIIGHVPIISATANARSEQIEVATAAGMDDVISKPFRVVDLIPKMQSLVQRYNS